MKCPYCSSNVPKDAMRCPGCGIVQVPGEDLAYHRERDAEFRAEREQARVGGRHGFGGGDPVAGRGRRFFGNLIDGFVLGIPGGVVASFATAVAGRDARPDDIGAAVVLLLTYLFVLALVWTAFEGSPWHATPGKKLLGMRVVDVLGEGANFGEAFGRNISRFFFSAIPFVGVLDSIWIFFNDEHQTLHDRVAGTRVVEP